MNKQIKEMQLDVTYDEFLTLREALFKYINYLDRKITPATSVYIEAQKKAKELLDDFIEN